LLFLSVSFLAADAEAHAAIHDDSHLPEHECVIVLVAHGYLTGPAAPVVAVDTPQLFCFTRLLSPAPLYLARQFELPPSCGPPAAV
jgi:hypothetical protein